MVWAQEGKAVKRANRALYLRGYSSVREPEPFAASSFARRIATRSMTGHGASGRGHCGTRRNARLWMSRCGISLSARAVSTNVRRDLPGNLDGTDNAASALLNTPNNIGQLAHLSTSNRAKPILKAGVRWLGCCRACRSENWKLAALVLSSRHSLGPFELVPCCSAMNSLSPYLLMRLVNALGNAWDVRVRVAPRPPSRGDGEC